MAVTQEHKALIRESLRGSGDTSPPQRKRRKTVNNPTPIVETVNLDSDSTDEFEDLEDVDLDAIADVGRSSIETTPVPDAKTVENGNRSISNTNSKDASEFGIGFDVDSDDSDDFDDLEDVDMDIFSEAPPAGNAKSGETLTFSIKSGKNEEENVKKKRTFTPIPKQERRFRKAAHKLILFSMVCHGAVRNRWCSDQRLLEKLQKSVSSEIVKLFDQDKVDVLDYVKAKRFIDGLRKLLAVFSKRFRVTCSGIQRREWSTDPEAGYAEALAETRGKTMDFDKFMKSVRTFQGSRDLGAQAFVAVLRSIGVNARLVFSIQTPDFRSIRPAKDGSDKDDTNTGSSRKKEPSKPQSEFDPVFIPNPRQAMLTGVRSRKKVQVEKPLAKKPAQNSNIPVFWIEVWNKYSKKWITVDPIVLKVVEVVPMRRKCKFDAAGTDETHQTWYVIAYDTMGKVKDVTRRYTQYYNAKTAKRRIGFGSEEDEHWYNRMLRAVGTPSKKVSTAEVMEMKEFHDRHICEGTPNNMADFKNHPVYALEPQLRQDEIIYPNDESSKCGTFRSSNKSSVMPVYKRSCVFRLKTPKAWHMNGRVLKVGAQPLKTKKALIQFTDEEGDDDGQVRLYAEFQTELFRPPPITDGKITKNIYGNVEIFKPSMIPENGFLVPIEKDVSLKMLETAARYILNIDYAKAIVSFEFGKGLKNRTATAKEGGILIDVQYKEAVLAVVDGLREQEEQEKREAVELNALRSWNFFLKKLQIVKRLDRYHGSVEDPETEPREKGAAPEMQEDEEEDGYFSVASDDANSENSDNDVYVPRPTRRSAMKEEPLKDEDDEDNEFGGGFFLDSAANNENAEDDFTEGGFFPEANDNFSNAGEENIGEVVQSDNMDINIFGESVPSTARENLQLGTEHEEVAREQMPSRSSDMGLLESESPARIDKPEPEPATENFPEKARDARKLRSRLRTAYTNAKSCDNTEVIDLDSDGIIDEYPTQSYLNRNQNRRALDSVPRVSARRKSRGLVSSRNEAGIDEEEQELGIEYSDSN